LGVAAGHATRDITTTKESLMKATVTHRILILGGGTGGTLAANRLRRLYSTDEATITVID
jgi:spermidine synthase